MLSVFAENGANVMLIRNVSLSWSVQGALASANREVSALTRPLSTALPEFPSVKAYLLKRI